MWCTGESWCEVSGPCRTLWISSFKGFLCDLSAVSCRGSIESARVRIARGMHRVLSFPSYLPRFSYPSLVSRICDVYCPPILNYGYISENAKGPRGPAPVRVRAPRYPFLVGFSDF